MDVVEKNATQARKITNGATADKKKQNFEEKLASDRTLRIGKAAEAFNKFHTAYANDYKLDAEEVIAAVYLEYLNCRHFYPQRHGGPPRCDEICAEVKTWFDEHKNQA